MIAHYAALGIASLSLALVLSPQLVAGNPRWFLYWPGVVVIGLAALWYAGRARPLRAAAILVAVLWASFTLPLIVVVLGFLPASAPALLQTWFATAPQYVFFGPRIYTATGTPLLPWAGVVTAVLWVGAALLFARATRPIRSTKALVGLAVVAVALITALFAVMIPLAGWQLRLTR